MKTKTILSIALAAFAMTACKESATTTSSSVETIAPDPALEKFFTDEAIADAKQITAARSTAKPGDEITLTGLVMGRTKVFVDGRASFVLGDRTTLTPCNAMEDDNCPTPWDACCDSKEALLNGIVSIQIVGEDGRVLSGNLKGTKGLKELSAVTVTGTVAEQSTPDALIVNATKIHVGE
jgi:hypothetical protein